MGDHSGSADVGAPAGQLFGYLSDISNLPRYITAMTSAEPAGQDEVHVVADVDGAPGRGRRGSGSTGNAGTWNGNPRDRTTITAIDVTGDGATASVTVFLHTERAAGEIDRGIAGTLAAIKQLAEAGPAPGPAS